MWRSAKGADGAVCSRYRSSRRTDGAAIVDRGLDRGGDGGKRASVGALRKFWGGPGLRIWRQRRRRFPADGASDGNCGGVDAATRTCCLDEPTNHLDLAGIEWLEGVLRNATFACVVVSHDRYFLENVANEVMELNAAYENGALRVSGTTAPFWRGRRNICMHSGTAGGAGKSRAHGD
jgi:hypothetical protein